MANIGEPLRIIEVEPLDEPVPTEPVKEPITPEPVKEPEKVPA